jgi:hypothetical protein
MFFFVTSHQLMFRIFHLRHLLQKVRERLIQKYLLDLIDSATGIGRGGLQ